VSSLRTLAVVLLVTAHFMSLALSPLRAQTDARASPAATVRAMWVWKTSALYPGAETAKFVTQAKAAEITDVFLFLRAADYMGSEAQLKILLDALSQAGIRSWGMEGWRGYFSDVAGPTALYAAADALVTFNKRNMVKFVGFHSDMEPQDGQSDGQDLFHNAIAQSALTPEQLADRDKLLTEWLTIHETLLAKMQAAGLQYGGAMPSWVDEYYGEPVTAIFKDIRQPLIQHLMPLVPQYVIMSYNTDPMNLINRIIGELQYASTLGGSPRVMFGVETHAGVGLNVSYADTPPKDNKSAVLADLATVDAKLLATHPKAYLGWAIHDWEGWKLLP